MNSIHLPQTEGDILNELTAQEFKVLRLASQELSNKEIGQRLSIAESTVKKHRENICRKLNIKGKIGMRKFLRWASNYPYL
jgi:DNA-binding NarL/FixJ family response regulator